MSKIALLLLLVAPAYAKPTRATPPAPPEGTRAQVRYDFDDDLVEGGVVGPDGSIVDTRRPIKHSSLIKIRETFAAEMIKSAEDQ